MSSSVGLHVPPNVVLMMKVTTKKRHYKVGADKARFKVPGGPGPGLPPTEGFIGADSTGATGNFAPVLTQEPEQTLRFAPVPFMAVL